MRFISLLTASCCCIVFMLSCANDDEPAEQEAFQIPATYLFDNVDYSEQTQILSMLLEMKAYLTSANTPGVVLDIDRLQAMSTNESGAGWISSYDESLELRGMTNEPEQVLFEQLMVRIAAASESVEAGSPGQAGVVVSNDGSKQYLLDENGVECAQFIEKGLMGACLYYQATSVSLGEDKMNADNSVILPGRGSDMEHHWDEAFGYLGVPKAFPADADGLFFWGTYSNRRDPLLGCNQRIMDALLKGRAAIGHGDLVSRDEAILEVRSAWEEISASTAVHYLNVALNQMNDLAIRTHALSEAIAFAYSLKFNPDRSLSVSEIDEILTLIGGSSNLLSINLYDSTTDRLNQARAALAQAFGFEAIADQL